MRNRIIVLTQLVLVICSVLIGCSVSEKKEDNSNLNMKLPEMFGAELHNIECTVYKEAGEKPIDFYIMSKIDISNNSKIELEYTGGSFEYSYTITKDEYKLEDYSTYVINLKLKDFVFSDEEIIVNKLVINCDDDKSFELIPQKLIINYVEGDFSNADLLFYGTPVSTPYEMNEFPFELGGKNKLTLKNITISNKLLKYENRDENVNKVINKNGEYVTLKFSTPDEELSKYTQYVTSVIFKYSVNGKEYIRMTPNVYVVYNPLFGYEDNFKMYYEEVLKRR